MTPKAADTDYLYKFLLVKTNQSGSSYLGNIDIIEECHFSCQKNTNWFSWKPYKYLLNIMEKQKVNFVNNYLRTMLEGVRFSGR